jgi:hypothetical protein
MGLMAANKNGLEPFGASQTQSLGAREGDFEREEGMSEPGGGGDWGVAALSKAFADRDAVALAGALARCQERSERLSEQGVLSATRWMGRAVDKTLGMSAWVSAPSKDEGLAPVEEAARWRWLDGVELLAAWSPAEALRSALAASARDGWLEGVEALLKAGAPKEPIRAKWPLGQAKEALLEREQGAKVGALSLACLGGHADCVKALLEAGSDPRESSVLGAALGCAVRGGSRACVGMLLKAEAYPDEPLPRMAKRSTDQGEWVFDPVDSEHSLSDAPLHWAAQLGQSAMVLDLLAAGAKADALNMDKETPLSAGLWMLPFLGSKACLSVEAFEALARAQGAPDRRGLAQKLAGKAAGLASPEWERVDAAARGVPAPAQSAPEARGDAPAQDRAGAMRRLALAAEQSWRSERASLPDERGAELKKNEEKRALASLGTFNKAPELGADVFADGEFDEFSDGFLTTRESQELALKENDVPEDEVFDGYPFDEDGEYFIKAHEEEDDALEQADAPGSWVGEVRPKGRHPEDWQAVGFFEGELEGIQRELKEQAAAQKSERERGLRLAQRALQARAEAAAWAQRKALSGGQAERLALVRKVADLEAQLALERSKSARTLAACEDERSRARPPRGLGRMGPFGF